MSGMGSPGGPLLHNEDGASVSSLEKALEEAGYPVRCQPGCRESVVRRKAPPVKIGTTGSEFDSAARSTSAG